MKTYRIVFFLNVGINSKKKECISECSQNEWLMLQSPPSLPQCFVKNQYKLYNFVVSHNKKKKYKPSPCISDVHNVRLSRKSCMISVESL